MNGWDAAPIPAVSRRASSKLAAGHRAHPLVGRIYPADLSAELKNLWKCRDILLAALDRLPQVLCHHDAFRRNLFLRSGRLLAVDWAFLGVGPLGAELAPLVTGSAAFLGIGPTQGSLLRTLPSTPTVKGWSMLDGMAQKSRCGSALPRRRCCATGRASCGWFFRRC
jgi:hypothetical protein